MTLLDVANIEIVERSSGYWIVENGTIDGPFIELSEAQERLAEILDNLKEGKDIQYG